MSRKNKKLLGKPFSCIFVSLNTGNRCLIMRLNGMIKLPINTTIWQPVLKNFSNNSLTCLLKVNETSKSRSIFLISCTHNRYFIIYTVYYKCPALLSGYIMYKLPALISALVHYMITLNQLLSNAQWVFSIKVYDFILQHFCLFCCNTM